MKVLVDRELFYCLNCLLLSNELNFVDHFLPQCRVQPEKVFIQIQRYDHCTSNSNKKNSSKIFLFLKVSDHRFLNSIIFQSRLFIYSKQFKIRSKSNSYSSSSRSQFSVIIYHNKYLSDLFSFRKF